MNKIRSFENNCLNSENPRKSQTLKHMQNSWAERDEKNKIKKPRVVKPKKEGNDFSIFWQSTKNLLIFCLETLKRNTFLTSWKETEKT